MTDTWDYANGLTHMPKTLADTLTLYSPRLTVRRQLLIRHDRSPTGWILIERDDTDESTDRDRWIDFLTRYDFDIPGNGGNPGSIYVHVAGSTGFEGIFDPDGTYIRTDLHQ